jgi:hypothetical protein
MKERLCLRGASIREVLVLLFNCLPLLCGDIESLEVIHLISNLVDPTKNYNVFVLNKCDLMAALEKGDIIRIFYALSWLLKRERLSLA